MCTFFKGQLFRTVLGLQENWEKGREPQTPVPACMASTFISTTLQNAPSFLNQHGGFPGGSAVKTLPPSAGYTGDMGSIPGSGRFPGVGNGNPFQYFCLENSMDRGAQWASVCGLANSRTWLNTHTCRNLHGHVIITLSA